MHFDALTAPEQRVLGSLIEKRFTTPDQYPLSVNALRGACNQSTNRDPVVAYDEATVYQAAQRLCQYGLARLASGHSSRATKFRHLAEEGLGLDREQLAVLCVLLLRGPQTPGELKLRTERMVALASLDDVERILSELDGRGYARRLGRRPGQKEDRFGHLLGGEVGGSGAADVGTPAPAEPGHPTSSPAPAEPGHPTSSPAPPEPVFPTSSPAPAEPAFPSPAPSMPAAAPQLEHRVAVLEAEVADLRAQLQELLG